MLNRLGAVVAVSMLSDAAKVWACFPVSFE